jgi:hypothetical protein
MSTALFVIEQLLNLDNSYASNRELGAVKWIVVALGAGFCGGAAAAAE